MLGAIDNALWGKDGGTAALTNDTAWAVVKGLGGVGKSVLAREYAWRNRERYHGVWWVRAENEQDPGVSEFLCKRFPLGIISFCVLLLQHAEEAKRSPNWMANWPMAAVHSMGLRQCTPAFLMAR